MFLEFIAKVAVQHQKNLPFVVYRKPDEVTVNAIFQENDQIYHTTEFNETGFVFAPFDDSQTTVLIPAEIQLQADYNSTINPKNDFSYAEVADAAEKEFHVNLVKKGIEQIEEGEFQKVVLSRKIENVCEASPVDIFQKLLATYDTAFCYLWHHPRVGTWLGATPEILKIENQQFTTMSLAGTQKYTGIAHPEWENKELEEQELVTEYIFNALKDTVTNVQISERESVRAGNLWHLRTKLTGIVEKRNLSTIISALHPTPAVCGLPMQETKAFILNHENYPREYYTGFLGELNLKTEKERSANRRNQENRAYRTLKKSTTLFVNLRCMQLKDNKAHIYVGGGVTKASEPEKEWDETVAKSNTMLKIILDN